MYEDSENVSRSELQFLHDICDQLRAGVHEISSVKASLLQSPPQSPQQQGQAGRSRGKHNYLPLWKTAPVTNVAASDYALHTSPSKRSLNLPKIERRATSPPVQPRKAAEQDSRIAAKRASQDRLPDGRKSAAKRQPTPSGRSGERGSPGPAGRHCCLPMCLCTVGWLLVLCSVCLAAEQPAHSSSSCSTRLNACRQRPNLLLVNIPATNAALLVLTPGVAFLQHCSTVLPVPCCSPRVAAASELQAPQKQGIACAGDPIQALEAAQEAFNKALTAAQIAFQPNADGNADVRPFPHCDCLQVQGQS